MARGRKPSATPTVQWSIMVPIDLAFRVETQLMDPVTNRATYASRSKLIQGLLYAWLNGNANGNAAQSDSAAVDTSQEAGLKSRELDLFNPATEKDTTP